MPKEEDIARLLLERERQTYGEELRVNLAEPRSSSLYRLLTAGLLFSANIHTRQALQAARALTEQRCTTPEAMKAASWQERTRILNQAGNARYDECTSSIFSETAAMLLDRYDGDLNHLRREANYRPEEERQLLKEFKGIGDVRVDIFFREVQGVGKEIFAYKEPSLLMTDDELCLPPEIRVLAALVGVEDFSTLATAKVCVHIVDDEYNRLKEARKL